MRSIRFLMMLFGLLATATAVRAQPVPTQPVPPVCPSGVCREPYRASVDGPPVINRKSGCARPICNPCELPQWSHYETCWKPWPLPPSLAEGVSPPKMPGK